MTYPADALATRVTGAVVVRAVTDASGRVIEAEPLSGPPVLRPSVVANIKQWILSPGARSEPMVYLFEIDYALCNDDSRSLFRLVYPNLAVITACSSPGRSHVPVRYDELPIASHGKTPNYPMIAQNAQVKGIVVLELSFDANGAVTPRALNDLPC